MRNHVERIPENVNRFIKCSNLKQGSILLIKICQLPPRPPGKYFRVVAILLASLLCSIAPFALDQASAERFEFSQPHMGVLFKLILYGDDPQAANLAASEAFQRIAELDSILSDYDPESELNQLSRASPTQHPIRVSNDLWNVLSASQEFSTRSQGAFDVTVGPYVRLWRRARRQKRLPTAIRLARAAESVGYDALQLDTGSKSVLLKKPRMRLDLGGIAKGYAIDEALIALRQHGFASALVDGGGDVACGDAPPGRAGWQIGVITVREDGSPEEYVSLHNCAVASSGDLFQYVEISGVRYSHIVDPRTGAGLTTRSNVTVFAPTCTVADALATAVSVLGADESQSLISETGESAAIIARLTEGNVRLKAIGNLTRYELSTLRRVNR